MGSIRGEMSTAMTAAARIDGGPTPPATGPISRHRRGACRHTPPAGRTPAASNGEQRLPEGTPVEEHFHPRFQSTAGTAKGNSGVSNFRSGIRSQITSYSRSAVKIAGLRRRFEKECTPS